MKCKRNVTILLTLSILHTTTQKISVAVDCVKKHETIYKANECLAALAPFFGYDPLKAENVVVAEFKFCIIQWISEYFGYPAIFITNEETTLQVSTFLQRNNFKQYENFVFNNRLQLLKNLLKWKANFQKLFAVFCSTDCAVEVLHLAFTAGVLDRQYMWIVLSNDLSNIEVELPNTLISIQYEKTPVNWKNNGSSTFPKDMKCSAYNLIRSNEEHSIHILTNHMYTSNYYYYDHHHGWALTNSEERDSYHIDLKPIDHSYCNSHERVTTVTILEPPFTMLTSTNPDPYSNQCIIGKLCFTYEHVGNTTARIPNCCYGYTMELLQKLEFDLNITADLYIVEDGLYGSGINGTWNGMIGDIVKGKAEIAIAPLTIFEKRTKVVDFTDAYMISGIGLGTIAQPHQLSFFNMEVFAPISWSLWLCLFVLTIFCSMLVYFMEYFQNGLIFSYSLTDIILYLTGIMFQKDLGESPRYLGTRVLSVSFAIVMLIIMSAYTAVLTANKVVHETNLPVSGFKDEKITNPTKDFVYGTIADSGIYRMFGDSPNPAWNRMYHFMRPYNFVNTQKAINDLKAGTLGAMIHDYVVLQYYGSLEKDCKIQLADSPIDDAGYGICSSKSSGWKRKLNNAVKKYKEDGTLSSLQKRWLSEKCFDANVEEIGPQAPQVFGGLFLMICGSFVLTLLLLMIENVIHCSKKILSKGIELNP